MKTSFSTAFFIWLKAQGLYLLLNCISPITWIISESFALICGIPALLLFWLYLYAVKNNVRNMGQLVLVVLAGGLGITFLSTLLAAYFFDSHNTWGAFQDYFLFPAAALVCAAVSILVSFRLLRPLLPQIARAMQVLPATIQNNSPETSK